MGGFRIGRKHAAHSYPDTRGGVGIFTPFARNFASGPGTETDITVDGVQVPWSAIDSGSPGPDVPITPQSTGIIRISGVLTIKNHSADIVIVEVQAQVNLDSLPFPSTEQVSILANGLAVIPILAEGGTYPVGVLVNVHILVSSNNADADQISIVMESSTLDVQEVSVATG